jgi:hypothetical protein
LGQLEVKEALPILKDATSVVVSTKANYTGCVNHYLQALAQVDVPAWRSFPYWSPGISEWGKLGINLKRVKDGEIKVGSAHDPVDATSPDASKIYQFLANIGPCGVFSGCKKGLDLTGYGVKVRILSPVSVEYLGEVVHDEGSNRLIVKSAFALVLKGTGDPERAWVVEDVRERPCDRCGQLVY